MTLYSDCFSCIRTILNTYANQYNTTPEQILEDTLNGQEFNAEFANLKGMIDFRIVEKDDLFDNFKKWSFMLHIEFFQGNIFDYSGIIYSLNGLIYPHIEEHL